MTTQTQKPVEHPLAPLPTAVIIGASTGIGAGLVRKFASEGYKLALVSRDKAKLETLCEEINQQAGEQRATFYIHDVTHFDEVPVLFQRILQDLKHIDVFIYNSGVLRSSGFSEYSFEKALEATNVNMLGAMAWLGQAAMFFERMGKGHLVGISSVAGDRGRVANPPYHASKAGMSAYLESLRNRLTRKGVHVLTVKPGYVQTAMMAGVQARFKPNTPDEVAKDVWRAVRRRKQVIYTPWWWRFILLVVTHIPSPIFRRMSF